MADLTGDPAFDGTIFCVLLPVQTLTQDNLFDLVVRSGYQAYDDGVGGPGMVHAGCWGHYLDSAVIQSGLRVSRETAVSERMSS